MITIKASRPTTMALTGKALFVTLMEISNDYSSVLASCDGFGEMYPHYKEDEAFRALLLLQSVLFNDGVYEKLFDPLDEVEVTIDTYRRCCCNGKAKGHRRKTSRVRICRR